jgi:hypothetical protein
VVGVVDVAQIKAGANIAAASPKNLRIVFAPQKTTEVRA